MGGNTIRPKGLQIVTRLTLSIYRNIMETTCVILDFLIATLKKVKIKVEINFHNMFYLVAQSLTQLI